MIDEKDSDGFPVDLVSRMTRERYSKRYEQLGRNIRTLGWGTERQQEYRFEQTLRCDVPFKGAQVLDIGCGFGDYLEFLIREEVGISSYTGWDLNVSFVEEAKTKFSTEKNIDASFSAGNILESSIEGCGEIADVAVMLGLLNFHWKGAAENIEYTKRAISNAFSLVRKTLVVDFLSEYRTSSYPKEDFVFYHDPGEMLRVALELTSDVEILHDYAPIPQKEFMLVLRK